MPTSSQKYEDSCVPSSLDIDNLTPLPIEILLEHRSGGAQIFGADWELAEAFAGGGEDSVGDGGGDGWDARFAAASGRVGAGQDVDIDLSGGVAHAQDFVIVKIALFDAATIYGDGALQGLRQAKIDGPFHLRLDAERIHGGAAIDGADDAIDTKSAFLCVAAYFGDLSDEAAPAGNGGDAAATACRERLMPIGFLGGEFDHTATAANINAFSTSYFDLPRRAESGEQEFDGVAVGGVRSLIEETRENKLISGSIDGAPVTERHA